MKKILAVLIGITLLSGCGPKELSPEQKMQVEALKSELAQTEKEITAANEMDSKYSSGLIKLLIATRTEVLGTNKALLQQRINAIESGAKIEIVVNGQKEDPEKAKEIESEINSLRAEIGILQKDADRYTGGLIRDLKLSAIATQEQTIALLQQRYLMAKYGISITRNEKTADKKENNSNQTANEIKQESQTLLPPADGPLGLRMGLSTEDISRMTGRELSEIEGKTNLYETDKTPKSNSEFDSYAFVISPKYGLCEIRAIGKVINTDGYGLQLRSKFDDMRSSLDSIYGKGKLTDKLFPGSIWDEPRYWMMSLLKNERFLDSEWNKKNEVSEKNNLDSVVLEARAISPESGVLFLQYDFQNSEKCQSEIKEAKKSSL